MIHAFITVRAPSAIGGAAQFLPRRVAASFHSRDLTRNVLPS